MPKKPTTDFGHIAFGKDGTVRPEFSRLPDSKEGQELEIAARFVERLNNVVGKNFEVRPLAEYDHDFELLEGGQVHAIVQEVEVTRHDFTWSLSDEDYDNRTPANVILSEGVKYGVDEAKLRSLIANKIVLKNAKNYQKPQAGEFWLLIWTVWLPANFVFDAKIKGEAIVEAEDYLSTEGQQPFDAIWIFSPSASAYRLKPNARIANVASREMMATPPGKKIVTVTIPVTELIVVKKKPREPD